MFDGSILKQDEKIKIKCAKYLVEAMNSNSLPAFLSQFGFNLFSKTKFPEAAIEDTRPVAIGSHLLKIAEKAIKMKLENMNSKLLQTDSYQAGFQTGLSTQKNLAFFMKKIMMSRKNTQNAKCMSR